MKDKSGKDINPGDIIVYGKSLGRCAGMQYGKVLYITKKPDRWSPSTKREKIRFIGVDDGWLYDKARLQKPATLEFSDRMLLVGRGQVSAKALKLLDTIDITEYQKEEK